MKPADLLRPAPKNFFRTAGGALGRATGRPVEKVEIALIASGNEQLTFLYKHANLAIRIIDLVIEVQKMSAYVIWSTSVTRKPVRNTCRNGLRTIRSYCSGNTGWPVSTISETWRK